MATEPQKGAISAAFPAPPPFYKSFTAENLESLQQYIEASSQDTSGELQSTGLSSLSITDLPSIPAEIRNLIPPAPPIDGKYRSFGTLHDISPPPPNPQTIPSRDNLLGLTDRLMQLFQRYVQIMATNPSGELWVPQWEEIKKTFEQVHGLINEYRPHEARENLILKYEDQIAQVKEESERVKGSIETARRVMEDLGKGGLADRIAATIGEEEIQERRSTEPNEERDPTKTKEKIIWNIIEREVGKA